MFHTCYIAEQAIAVDADNQNVGPENVADSNNAIVEAEDQQGDGALVDARNTSVGDGYHQPHAQGLNAIGQKSQYILLLGGRGRGIPLSNSVFYTSHLRAGRQTLPPSTENAEFLWGGENGTRLSRKEVECRLFNDKKPSDRYSVITRRSIDSILLHDQ